MQVIDLMGQAAHLLPEGALWLPQRRCLLVADVHLGKAVSFRRLGVPVPRGTTADTLARLSALLARHQPARLVFLGDLLHSRHVHTSDVIDQVAAWRRAHAAVGMTLVRGNHDDRAGDPPPSWQIDVVDEPWPLGALALCHHPRQVPGALVLAGHWHPCVSLAGRGRERLRLPCFWWRADMLLLPAFGAFTGMHPIEPVPGDRVYALAEDAVVAVPCGTGR